MVQVSDTLKIDLRRLDVLAELSRRGTITATAAALHLTPSAVSQQISALASDLGVPLVEPAGRKVRLTNYAEVVLDHRAAILAELERLHADLDSAKRGHRGSIVIGAFSSAIPVLIPPLISHFQETYPGVIIEVREGAGHDMLTGLDAGVIDLVIAVIHNQIPPLKHANYSQEILFQNFLDLVVRDDHWAAKETRVEFSTLSGERWIMGDESTCRGSILRSHALASGFIPDVRSSANDWQATVALVSAGLGIGVVGRMTRRDLPEDVKVVPFKSKISQSVSMISRRDGSEHPLVSAAAAYIRGCNPLWDGSGASEPGPAQGSARGGSR